MSLTFFLPCLVLSNGLTDIQKQCGQQEYDGFDYNEGCDSISIPFDKEECYCKEDLCNGALNLNSSLQLLLFLTFLVSIFKFGC